ncbi:3-hydroxy-9,10-secoandrosta-1,3,5(10)-triene-9,17-dione monooxygenase reductase component [Haloechinothrix alba]|uniref:3-hydroxy-9,10-secoandrosta-1,3,5(10)-triene-9,17-dione monooxygenase reductase component n=1 Tax=Haloechinothrix alba TaxID=664784 RepID=A0A238XFM2_9PSEU|nr:3-hydroxy-9,10-secoandrosta-1,3,5(10)-triene-9,17-dione monooxygenase reductase subunit [Haloechinothrix alba]SNR57482.1 3-hydroxy-9,10-secoandrosta-1,3,5(10)-triene-9,17-dione monooxygenase reductase component [Haloechinothrix alba]
MTAQAATGQDAAVDAARFRTVLGHFCTGVTVVTGYGPDGPVGFACQSFAALSLDPPYVLFCPGKTSRAWPVIEAAGYFAVNVLGESQRDVSTVFGSPGDDRFSRVGWTRAESGAPLLDGALTWIDCAVETVHDAGDHFIVVGRVRELGDLADDRPLLFYRGRYAAIGLERGEAAPAPEHLTAFLTWPGPDDWV